MAIQTNFPAIKPSLLLDFANTKALDPRITFTRASEGRYYDGKTVAKAEENLLLQSQDFTTTWTTASQNATVTANTTAAPDGTTTADTLTDNATSGVHRVAQTITTSNNNQLVLSCFLKYSTMQWVSLSAATNTGQWAGAKFDVQNGVLGSTSQQGTGWTADSSSITSVGNGWYRCVLVFTPGNSGSLGVYVNGATDGTTFTTSQRGSEVYVGTGSEVFIWGAQLEQRSSVTAYTATTTQPITNYIPVLLTAPAGVARFDHNPTTGESLGLLIEEQRTNLLTYSEQLDNAAWSKFRTSITANTIVAPDGALTGDKLVEDTSASNTHYLRVNPDFNFAANTAYTLTVYLKAGERTSAQVALNLFSTGNLFATGRPAIDVNLSTGTIISATSGVTASSITNVGNGWYRCSVSGLMGATGGTQATGVYILDSSNSNSYTGNGYSGIYIWGAQLEAGAFPTSYIPTVAAQVTRSADAASMTGTNFSSWYRPDEGALYGESSSSRDTSTRWPFGVDDGSASNVIGVRFTSTQVQNKILASAVTQADIVVAHTTGYAKTALGYKFNDVAASVNGGAAGTDTSANIPVVSQFTIGRISGGTTICGHIRKIAYYPARVTNTNLQALTS